MDWILIAIGILSYFFGLWAGGTWEVVLGTVAMWTVIAYVSKRILKEDLPALYNEVIEDYPYDKCVKPNKFKELFPYNQRHSGKELPKEIYIIGVGSYVGFIIISVVMLVLLPINHFAAFDIAYCYFIAGVIPHFFFLSRGTRKAFLAHYKTVNRHNFYRYFWNMGEPNQKFIGKCVILEECKKRRRTFFKIQMRDSGEIIENVLLSGSRRTGEKPLYSLYEICKVKYIT